MDPKPNPTEPSEKTSSARGAVKLLVLFGVLFLGFLILCNYSSLSSVFSAAVTVLAPILGGLGIAFVLNIPLRFFERHWIKRFGGERRRLRRTVCLLLCFLLLAALIALLAVAVLPQLSRTLTGLVNQIPGYIERIKSWWSALSDFLLAHEFPLALPPLDLDSAQIGQNVGQYLEDHGHLLVGASMEFAFSAFMVTLDVVVAFVIAIYVLAQKEKLSGQVNKLLRSLFSRKSTERIRNFARMTEEIFSKFITGQITEAVIIGTLCFIGMLIFRMPYALLISFLVGFTALIPIFGAFVGTAVGAFLILLDDPIKAVWFLIFILVLQQVEGNLIYPKVVGKSVGLPGIWVLVAVTVGSSFGIVGMLISVPVFSVFYCVLRQFADSRIEKKERERQEREQQEKQEQFDTRT